jgi:methylenetetrahydrofolate reductase (NADPH)
MRIIDMYRQRPFVFSLEVFPPKTDEGLLKLQEKLRRFAKFRPDFISVTYGAGGGTRHNTQKLADFIRNELDIEVMAHLTCVSHTPEDINDVTEALLAVNVENIMALRGDPPQNQEKFVPVEGGYRYASELITELASQQRFGIGAAGYPEAHVEAVSAERDRFYLRQKLEVGADFVITQFFLRNEHFLSWRAQLQAEGVKAPLIPGVICASSPEQIQRFAGMCGCEVPAELVQRLQKFEGDAAAMLQAGIDYAEEQIEGLLRAGVEGVHLYALNRLEVLERLAPRLRQEVLKAA